MTESAAGTAPQRAAPSRPRLLSHPMSRSGPSSSRSPPYSWICFVLMPWRTDSLRDAPVVDRHPDRPRARGRRAHVVRHRDRRARATRSRSPSCRQHSASPSSRRSRPSWPESSARSRCSTSRGAVAASSWSSTPWSSPRRSPSPCSSRAWSCRWWDDSDTALLVAVPWWGSPSPPSRQRHRDRLGGVAVRGQLPRTSARRGVVGLVVLRGERVLRRPWRWAS